MPIFCSSGIKIKTCYNVFILNQGKNLCALWPLFGLMVFVFLSCQSEIEEELPLCYPVEVGGKWGFIDTTGKMMISPRFSKAYVPFSVRTVVNFDDTSKVVIDERGEFIFSLPKILMPVHFNGEWFNIDVPGQDSIYFLDLNGQKKLAIARKGIGDIAGNFDACNRLLLIISEQKCVYANKRGEPIFSIKRGIAGRFDAKSKLARAIYKAKTCYYDTMGQVKFCFSGEGTEFSEGFALIENKQKKYFINESGKTKLDVSQYDQVFPFQENLALVFKGDHQGYINCKGKLCIPLQYKEISNFTLGVAAAKDPKDNKWILINTQNKVVSNKRFDWLDRQGFQGYLCKANIGDTTGWINRKGQFVWVDRD